ncbi:MAG TPA: hypothetical protein VL283_03170 [Candidatus Baltobacteraceae bacterium]|nr:hypothetical protein [Candidatus Baltobacteraceae bacterium]
MEDTLALDWFALSLPAIAALFCLVSAVALSGLIRFNKGAKINRAWGFIAFGLACFGLAALDRVFQTLDLPNADAVRDALFALGALFIMIGAVYARGLHKDLLK